jgi:predicted dehydrogenase
MDYTKSNLKFKILKTLRYLKLYGLSRTLIKIAGQYHMSNKVDDIQGNLWINERIVGAKSKHNGIAIVGCGNFSFSNIAFYLKKRDHNFLLATFDVNIGRAISLARKYKGKCAFRNFEDIITNDDIKLVFIASNHATHASYAIECINAGKDVHIEKPTVVSYEQLELLTKAAKENPTVKIYQGYNRPKSKLYCLLSQYLAVETGPLMINWFIAGHEIEDNHWYFNEEEGGRILGNLCHWSDLTLELVGYENAFPCKIKNLSPKNSKSDFVISIEFNDKSCAAITFSAKGHTFEGVREILNIHKGNLLGILRDFHSLELDILERKIIKKIIFRDHGHQNNVNYTYDGSVHNSNQGVTLQSLSATSLLALKIKESVDNGIDVTLTKEEVQNYC